MLKEKGFYRGINFGGWFSQCDYTEDTLNHFITESDFAQVAAWGLDHVRIPVDYNVLENNDGSYRENSFARLQNAVATARKFGLRVVIDLHKTAGFSFDAGENESGFFENEPYQERFYRLWEAIAERFGNHPDMIAFELLNEVTDQKYIDAWNRISYECIRRIRVFALKTIILVGSYLHNSPQTICELAPPYDNRIVFNFHCYEPIRFTHQGAYWTDQIIPDERFRFAELNITADYFENLFCSALETAERFGTELYCGEFGVIDIVPPEESLKWFRTLHAVLEKYHIPRAAWSYKAMDFGISDPHMNGIRDDLLKVL